MQRWKEGETKEVGLDGTEGIQEGSWGAGEAPGRGGPLGQADE